MVFLTSNTIDVQYPYVKYKLTFCVPRKAHKINSKIMDSAYYPLSPSQVPQNLTRISSNFRIKALLAILSVILFFLLYFSLVIGLAYLVKYAIIYPIESVNKLTLLAKAGAIAGSVMLFIFTLKFVFKLKNHKAENRIKLNKKEHENLWRFVHQICNETGAPKPKSIYVDPDVNAYVAYTNMWLSLILPVKKDLTIGLSLVSCLTVSEFKAVISHEFGHFAQKSMKIGSYIISANTIIHDMIYSRDKWDDLLAKWRNSDIRLSAAAWIITPIIWLIRKTLALFYQFLNMMHSSLSREMEYNADKVAVSTSGSEAIISALWKLDNGVECWNSTIHHAYLAGQKNKFVNNLYIHNQKALERTQPEQEEKRNHLAENPLGGKQYFTTSASSKVSMYASHPPNDLREQSAKNPFVPCPQDNRSPWILFSNPTELQQKVSQVVYQQYLNKEAKEFFSVPEFEQFIQAENAGKELHAAYFHTFENRFFTVPSVEHLEENIAGVNNSSVLKAQELKDELKRLMEPVKKLEGLMEKAQLIANGTTTEKSFSLNNKIFTRKNIGDGYSLLIKEREELFSKTFQKWDADFCTYYYALANQKGYKHDLKSLYGQQRLITKIYLFISAVRGQIQQSISDLQSRSEVSQLMVQQLGRDINKLTLSINNTIDEIDKLDFVALPNIQSKEELKNAILEGGKFKGEYGDIFNNGGINRIFMSIDQAFQNCQRIEQKNITAILQLHEELSINNG